MSFQGERPTYTHWGGHRGNSLKAHRINTQNLCRSPVKIQRTINECVHTVIGHSRKIHPPSFAPTLQDNIILSHSQSQGFCQKYTQKEKETQLRDAPWNDSDDKIVPKERLRGKIIKL